MWRKKKKKRKRKKNHRTREKRDFAGPMETVGWPVVMRGRIGCGYASSGAVTTLFFFLLLFPKHEKINFSKKKLCLWQPFLPGASLKRFLISYIMWLAIKVTRRANRNNKKYGLTICSFVFWRGNFLSFQLAKTFSSSLLAMMMMMMTDPRVSCVCISF